MENNRQGRIVRCFEVEPNIVYFGVNSDPEKCNGMRTYTIKPKWLMTFVLWVLIKMGMDVKDLRDRNEY